MDPLIAKLKKTIAELDTYTAHHTRSGDRTKEIVFAGRNKSDGKLAAEAGVRELTIYRHRAVLDVLESLVTDEKWTAEKDILTEIGEPELARSWLYYLTVKGHYRCMPDEYGNRYKRIRELPVTI